MTEKVKIPTAAQALKLEFDVYKQRLLSEFNQSLAAFRKFVFEKEPSWKTIEGVSRISNVWNGRTSDINLNRLIEEFITELQTKNLNK